MDKIYCPRCGKFKLPNRFRLHSHICEECNNRGGKASSTLHIGINVILTDEEIILRRVQAQISKPKDWLSLQDDYENSDADGDINF